MKFKIKKLKLKVVKTVSSLFILTILLGTTAFFLTKQTKAAWWNDSFLYRQKVVINNTGSVLTDYQTAISIDTSALINARKMQSDCDDIRLTDVNGNPSRFPYWIENCNTTATKIWIKYASLAAGNTVQYVYYGNSTAASQSSPGNLVFDFFDDFAGSSLDTTRWTRINSGVASETVSDSQLTIVGAGDMWDTSDTSRIILPLSPFTGDYIAEAGVASVSYNYQRFFGLRASATAANSRMVALLADNDQSHISTIQRNTDGASVTYQGENVTAFSEPFSARWVRNGTTTTGFVGSTQVNQITGIANLDYPALTATGGNSVILNYFFIRQYTTTEPTVTLSSQEKAASPLASWAFDEGFGKSYPSPITVHEQQINIIDQAFATYTTSPVPIDNSLGIIHWDSTKYPGATVYFEVETCYNGGGQWNNAYLYTTAGVEVTALYQLRPGCWLKTRSNALTLTTGDYTVRLKSSESYDYLRAARLIVVQTDPNLITQTETQIEIGNNETTSSSTFASLTHPKIWSYDSDKFSPIPTAYFEASLKGGNQPTIEQHINIITQTYSTTTQSPVPGDNSLGLIHWDPAKYPGASVYFEVETCYNGGGGQTNAYLYTSAGAEAAALTGLRPGCWLRSRSGALSLSAGDYTVRLRSSESNDSIRAARLVIIQTDTTKITDTEGQIEIGTLQTTASASYVNQTDKKIYHYDEDVFTPIPTAYFEATLSNDTAGQTAYAALYTDGATCSTVVSGSEVTVTGTTWGLVRSAAITLADDTDYTVCIKAGANNARIANAKIILDQSDSGGITDTQILHQQVNQPITAATNSYASQYFRTRFNPNLESTQSSFGGGSFSYAFEATLKTSAGTGYAQLYDTSASSAISGSEVSTSSTSYSRVRSSDITTNLPSFPTTTAAHTMDTQAKNSTTDTTSVSTSSLVVNVTNLSTAGGAIAYADLYDLTANATVQNSEVQNATSNWTRSRSGSIVLTDGHQYLARIKSGNNNHPIFIANGKIILDQSSDNGIYATETVNTIMNSPSTDADNTYSSQNYLYTFTPSSYNYLANYTSIPMFFETTIKTSAGTGYAQLIGSGAITGSEVSSTSTGYESKRSTDISSYLPTITTTLDSQLKNSATNTTSVAHSALIVQNNNTVSSGTADGRNVATASLNNNPTWKTEKDCVENNCLQFDGSNDFLLVSDSKLTDFAAADAFTLSGWFKTTAATGTLMAKYNASTNTDGGYKIYLSDGKIVGAVDDDNTWGPDDSVTSLSTYNDNTWHHFALVKSGTSSLSLYVDAIKVANNTSIQAAGTLVNTDNLYMGIDGDGTSTPFAGLLDSVKMYDYALTPAQIKLNFNQNSAISIGPDESAVQNHLALHWKLDDTGTPAVDSSGLGNSGTWNDGSTYSAGKFGNAINLDGTNDRITSNSINGLVDYQAWYHSDWSKRKSITLTNNTASVLTDYQTKLILTYDTDMQADFEDIRFTNTAGVLLDYWIESKIDSTTATIWVEVDSIPASGYAVIYAYYGNSGAPAGSNGTDTFPFFDDFMGTGVDTGKWSTSGSVTVSSGMVTLNRNGVDTQLYSINPFSISEPYVVDVKYQRPNYYRNRLALGTSAGAGSPTGFDYGDFDSSLYWDGWTGTSLSNNTWYLIRWIETGSDYTWKVLNTAGAEILSRSLGSNINNAKYLNFLGSESDNSDLILDWVMLRQYAATEPTTSISAEQSSGLIPAMTLSVWVNADTLGATDRVILARGNDGSGYNWILKNDASNPGKIKFTSDGGAHYGTGSTTITTGSWYHLTLVANQNTSTLFVNGMEDSVITTNGSIPGNVTLSAGADNDGGNGWDGKIDEVRIYSAALSPAEVQKLYNWSPGPVGYWNLDDNSGATANDTSGNNRPGTLTGGPLWGTGKIGSGVTFDGTNDFIDVGTGPTQVNTISFWVKPQTTTEYLVNLTSNTHYIWLNGGVLTATGLDTPAYHVNGIPSSTLVPNQWQHVTVTTATAVNADNLDFGRTQDTNYLEGSLDDIKLYDYIRTDTQIISDMNGGHPAPGSPIGSAVAHWTFNEGNQSTAHDSGFSGSNLFTASSSVWTTSGKFGSAFDGASDKRFAASDSGADDPDLEPQVNEDFTLSLWGKSDGTTTASNEYLISKGGSGEGGYQLYFNTSGQVVCAIDDDTASWPEDTVTSSQDYYDTTWHHLVCVRDVANTKLKLYVDGQLVAQKPNITTVGYLGTEGVAFILGDQNYTDGSDEFLGNIDEVKYYNFSLTADQIKIESNHGSAQDMSSFSDSDSYCPPGQGSTCSSPTAEWKMDENTGSYAYSINDYTIHNSDTTFPSWIPGKTGSALSFNGTTDGVMSEQVIQLFASNTMTIQFWLNLAGNPAVNAPVMGKDACWANDGCFVIIPNSSSGGNNFQFYTHETTGDKYNSVEFTRPASGAWHHYAFVINKGATAASEITPYLDGQLVSYSKAFSADQTSTFADLNINLMGFVVDNVYLAGKLDQVVIYNHVRTPAQIAWDYNRGAPVAQYNFNECQGTTLHDTAPKADKSITGLNGTINPGDNSGNNDSVGSCDSGASGSTNEMWNAGTTGKYNSSLSFDDTNDYVSVPDNTSLNLSSMLTLSAWVKSAANETDNVIISKGASYEVGLTSDGDLYWDGAGAQVDDASAKVLSGTWHHIVVTNDDYTVTLYVDGVKTGSTTAGIDTDNATDLYIGYDGTNYFDGQIDNVQIYNYPLTPTQVKTLYNHNSAVTF